MKDEQLEMVRGSGNVFRDLGRPDADVLQVKAILAAEIVKALDKDRLTLRAAHERTGISAADFSRIRGLTLASDAPAVSCDSTLRLPLPPPPPPPPPPRAIGGVPVITLVSRCGVDASLGHTEKLGIRFLGLWRRQ